MQMTVNTKRASDKGTLPLVLCVILLALSANCYLLIENTGKLSLIAVFVCLFVLANILPLLIWPGAASFRLRVCRHGLICLKAFVRSSVLSVVFQIVAACILLPGEWLTLLWSIFVCVCAEIMVLWNGIICVFCFSVQLGIRHRVIGIIFGLIPVLNLFVLKRVIKTVSAEVSFEAEKARFDLVRKDQELCKTKYPLLLVHGVFFRDNRFLNYWGRIPGTLKNNGAEIYYGEHQSAASVVSAGEELAAKIQQIVSQAGCGKVNIIAHSKGGLDSRYAVGCCGASPYVASITTINTPHRGCEFADYLLEKIPEETQKKLASVYNSTLLRLGDENPDFMAAVRDLTAAGCRELNEHMEDPQDIFCQSVGSIQNKATSGRFPLNFTQPMVKYFDGPNDGLVSETSFKWGENYQLLSVSGRRGISHGDIIDLNRENIEEFDVREFFVHLVADIKQRGF